MYKIDFQTDFYDSIEKLKKEDRKLAVKVLDLILEISKNPTFGTGNPEPLKNNLSGFWSRRINLKHRLIYKIETDTVLIFSCYSHYSDK